jgi:sugar/nucleoside kinase (ribokinase family)
MSKVDVLCVGIAVADVMAKSIDEVPDWDRLGTFDHIEHHIGGCAVNTAADLVRLGASAGAAACLGRDGAGLFVRNAILAAGIAGDGLVETDAAATSYTFVMIGSDGRRRYLHHVGANAHFTEADVPDELIARARILHMGGSLLMPAMDGEPTARLLARARQLGVITSMDTAYNPNVDSCALIEPCLPHLDIFMPSIEEARAITGEADPNAILAQFVDYPIEILGVKLGSEGCAVRVGDGVVRFPAYRAEVVDGSGAGDAFMAGLLYGVLQGWLTERSIAFANATAAHCIQAIGCSAGVPSAQQVASFMQEHDR